ncbi:MAG: hypothetical protein P8179_21640 [Candidatus Thiodiazotropha sp.]
MAISIIKLAGILDQEKNSSQLDERVNLNGKTLRLLNTIAKNLYLANVNPFVRYINKTIFWHQYYKYFGLIICMILLDGCASTTLYTPLDYCANPIGTGMARIVLDRPSGAGGAGAKRIFDSGQVIGDIGPWGKICWDRYPGKAIITEKYVEPFVLETKAGYTYHLNIRDKFLNTGWFIELVDVKQ